MNTITPNYNLTFNTVQPTKYNKSIGFMSLKPLLNDSVELSKKIITEKDYKKAQKYADKMSHMPKIFLGKEKTLKNMDMKKIEGLQYGIPVFAGMSMKEIAFAIDSIHSVATLRSCENGCLHCYADAKPNAKYGKTEGLTNRMDFEDFKGLTDGISELKNRLGKITINSSKKKSPLGETIYTASSLFHDSDCINVYMKDKSGKVHNFPELNKMLIDSTGQKGFFDTAGWNIHDKAAQERAEDVAAYFANPRNDKELEQFNISINAFNPWSAKAADLRKEGKTDLADRIEDRYADRMANVLMTFVPVMKKPYFGVIARALPDGTRNAEGFCVSDLNRMRSKIYVKVDDKINKLFEDNPEYRHSEEMISYYTDALSGLRKALSNPVETSLLPSGRYIDFAKKHSIPVADNAVHEMTFQRLSKHPDDKDTANNLFKIVDANGDLYLTDYITDVPTDIHFNFENHGLKTPKMNNVGTLRFTKDSL